MGPFAAAAVVAAALAAGAGFAAAPAAQSRLSISALPDGGTPPLTVTLALRAPRVARWRVDFGDGRSKVGAGKPPPTLVHTYAGEGDFRPQLSVVALPTSKKADTATANVSVHVQPLVTVAATPSSGKAPLAVRVVLGTSIGKTASWAVDFGDGYGAGASGTPPTWLTRTYARAGTYRVSFTVRIGPQTAYTALTQVTVSART